MNIQKLGITQNPVYFQNRQISAKQNRPIVCAADSSSVLNSLSFLGNYNKPLVKDSIDVPIKNDEEFHEVMERVYNAEAKGRYRRRLFKSSKANVWIMSDYKKRFPEYADATDIEMGLIPYCGERDNSNVINMYLSGRLKENDSEISDIHMPKDIDSCVDVIRTLDYSLNNLDKEFGKYEGIVYRLGYMSEEGGQYFSTSKSLDYAKRSCCSPYFFNENRGYSVIRLKNGHKIYEFQAKMGSDFTEDEEEVLIGHDLKFRKLKPEEMDEGLLKAREEMAKNLFEGADKILSGQKPDSIKWNRDEILNFVDVYEEV